MSLSLIKSPRDLDTFANSLFWSLLEIVVLCKDSANMYISAVVSTRWLMSLPKYQVLFHLLTELTLFFPQHNSSYSLSYTFISANPYLCPLHVSAYHAMPRKYIFQCYTQHCDDLTIWIFLSMRDARNWLENIIFQASHAGFMRKTHGINANIPETVISCVECSFVCCENQVKLQVSHANRKGERQYIYIVKCTGHRKKENITPPHLMEKLTFRYVW